jgi:hypothetical protein
MPTLNWIGKEAVVDHHRRVPTRLLEGDAAMPRWTAKISRFVTCRTRCRNIEHIEE